MVDRFGRGAYVPVASVAGAGSGISASPQGWVGVVDIGSNSIRIVVYSRLGRAPVVIHNEKVLCGLGKTLEQSGKLNPEGVELAIVNLARFRHLAEAMRLVRLDVIATAAVRDAVDGPEFVARVRRECGLDITVISGEEEARLSAVGVISGTPWADGVMGDLGGGSLELVGIDDHALGSMVTTPLGPLRLMGISGGKDALVAEIDKRLDAVRWLSSYAGRNFYPVGGAWRSLAKAHMEQTGHPIHIVHDYEVSGPEITELASRVAAMGKPEIEKLPGASRRRRDVLPVACLVLERLLMRLEPRSVIFSAFGLREGVLFDQLPDSERIKDPLLDACEALEHTLGRFGHGEILTAWTSPLFPEETPGERRLRVATCTLSDVGWFEHPDYRAEHAYLRVLRMPFAALSHPERAFLALAIHARYSGDAGGGFTADARRLLDERQVEQAVRLGLALRLAHNLSGGAPALLAPTDLTLTDSSLLLSLPREEDVMIGDAVMRRFEALASALGVTASVQMID
ncbi:Ppx/GppA phosphatase family protein [Radicibacter daui]|uniref:Ppx/GppA phosphatase family protein n=1 Tax=Radicibacter daui TaxID=3064829 RepID=UPI004046C0A7